MAVEIFVALVEVGGGVVNALPRQVDGVGLAAVTQVDAGAGFDFILINTFTE